MNLFIRPNGQVHLPIPASFKKIEFCSSYYIYNPFWEMEQLCSQFVDEYDVLLESLFD